jgi:hypothetical protein
LLSHPSHFPSYFHSSSPYILFLLHIKTVPLLGIMFPPPSLSSLFLPP